jgi:hypothetical protein
MRADHSGRATLWLAIAAASSAILMPSQSEAQALSPKPPMIERFTDCKRKKDPKPYASVEICTQALEQARPYLGIPVDGSLNKRNFGWILSKYTINSHDAVGTIYEVAQIAYDCKAGQAMSRVVSEVANLPGAGFTPVATHSGNFMKWSTLGGVNLAMLQSKCPAEPGFTRIGNLQFALNQVLRRGSIVNVRTINNSGREVVFSIDCSALTFGINAKPSRPITPGSVGNDVYKRLCL